MRIIVTGGSGGLGSAVIRDLAAAGHEVHNFDQVRPQDRLPARTHILNLADAGQFLDLALQVRAEAFVHLAADPRPYGPPRHPQFRDNLAMTHLVLQTAADLDIRNIAIASSEMASGWSSRNLCPPRIPFDETMNVDTGNAYALSKRLGEHLADGIAAANPNLSIASLRINYVLLGDARERVQESEGRWPGWHTNFWSYVDVQDAARAFRLAIETPMAGHRIYMVAATDTLTSSPTAEAIRKFFGPDIEIDPELPEFGSAIDCSRIAKDLGWVPHNTWRNIHENEVVS